MMSIAILPPSYQLCKRVMKDPSGRAPTSKQAGLSRAWNPSCLVGDAARYPQRPNCWEGYLRTRRHVLRGPNSLDGWEDVPPRARFRTLTDCAILCQPATFCFAHTSELVNDTTRNVDVRQTSCGLRVGRKKSLFAALLVIRVDSPSVFTNFAIIKEILNIKSVSPQPTLLHTPGSTINRSLQSTHQHPPSKRI